MKIANNTYQQFVSDIKTRIRDARYKALQAVNKEQIQLYWDIGKMIVEKQEQLGWGKSVVEQLSKDLQTEFVGLKGFSSRNLWLMRQFYSEYQENEILQPMVAEIGCKSKNRTTVEYALRETRQPIGVTTYTLYRKLPKEWKKLLPSPGQIKENLKIIDK